MAKDPRKLPPTAVGPSANPHPPPRKLGRHGTSLWNAVMTEYHIEDAGGIELLAQACAAVDRVEALALQRAPERQ
jgi:hypothetical protein